MAEISTINSVTSTEIASVDTVLSENIATINGLDLITFNPDSVRGVFGGGGSVADFNVIDYVTISTTSASTDFGDLTLARRGVTASSNGVNQLGVFAGGANSSSVSNICDYIDISSIGNAIDFGDLQLGRFWIGPASNGPNERAIFAGGMVSTSTFTPTNIIGYITVNSAGNASDFGDTYVSHLGLAGTSNSTNERAIFAGGDTSSSATNIIQYCTLNSPGNTADFGDLIVSRRNSAGTSNGTEERAVWIAGSTGGGGATNSIEYSTINSLGNSTDFGDVGVVTECLGACSNSLRGVFAWQNSSVFGLDYITIATPSNSTLFGSMSVERHYPSATSDFA